MYMQEKQDPLLTICQHLKRMEEVSIMSFFLAMNFSILFLVLLLKLPTTALIKNAVTFHFDKFFCQNPWLKKTGAFASN